MHLASSNDNDQQKLNSTITKNHFDSERETSKFYVTNFTFNILRSNVLRLKYVFAVQRSTNLKHVRNFLSARRRAAVAVIEAARAAVAGEERERRLDALLFAVVDKRTRRAAANALRRHRVAGEPLTFWANC